MTSRAITGPGGRVERYCGYFSAKQVQGPLTLGLRRRALVRRSPGVSTRVSTSRRRSSPPADRHVDWPRGCPTGAAPEWTSVWRRPAEYTTSPSSTKQHGTAWGRPWAVIVLRTPDRASETRRRISARSIPQPYEPTEANEHQNDCRNLGSAISVNKHYIQSKKFATIDCCKSTTSTGRPDMTGSAKDGDGRSPQARTATSLASPARAWTGRSAQRLWSSSKAPRGGGKTWLGLSRSRSKMMLAEDPNALSAARTDHP